MVKGLRKSLLLSCVLALLLPSVASADMNVSRIAGQNRYKTAIEIAKAYKPVLNKDINTIVLVDGTNYPDALASGTVATFENGAILLTQPNKLNENTRDFIEENNIEKVIIVGGEKSVSKNVENELRGL